MKQEMIKVTYLVKHLDGNLAGLTTRHQFSMPKERYANFKKTHENTIYRAYEGGMKLKKCIRIVGGAK